MKKIDKLFIKAYLGPFILTTAVVVFIFLMRLLMMYFDQFIGKNLEYTTFAKLFTYFTLITVPTALPLATLLATLMCFGNLGEHSELTAMRAAGISLTRLVVPTFLLSVLVSLFSLYFNNYINPWANLKGYSLLYDIKTTKLAFNIQEGIFYNELPGYRIKVGHKDADGKTMQNVIVYDHNNSSGNKNVTVADSGRMYTINNESQLVFELFNGTSYSEGTSYNNSIQLTKYGFQKNKMVFSLSGFGMQRTDENAFLYHEFMKSIPELNHTIDSLQKVINEKNTNQALNLKSYNSYSNFQDTTSIKPGKWATASFAKSRKVAAKNELENTAKMKIESLKQQVESDLTYLNSMEKSVWAADLERWNKITTAFSCLAMFLIGASLGAIIKKGGFGMPVLISIGFFILYYILQQLGNKYAREGLIHAVTGAWFPVSTLFVIGLILLRKARNI